MKLIIWLGNPGTKYEHTRHNVGFLFVEYLANIWWGVSFHQESKFESEIAEVSYKWEKTLLVKPQTFMNLSGNAVLKLMSFYKIKKQDLVVIFDDISMDFGKIRFREKGSAGGQNGVKSIIGSIWEDFMRIKIGVGNNPSWDLSDWVLSKFSPEEQEKLTKELFWEAKILLEKHF